MFLSTWTRSSTSIAQHLVRNCLANIICSVAFYNFVPFRIKETERGRMSDVWWAIGVTLWSSYAPLDSFILLVCLRGERHAHACRVVVILALATPRTPAVRSLLFVVFHVWRIIFPLLHLGLKFSRMCDSICSNVLIQPALLALRFASFHFLASWGDSYSEYKVYIW